MEEVFRTRRIKIKLISFDVGNVDIIVENKRRLLYYSNNKTSDELWESFSDVLRILSTSKKYKTAKRWWINQLTKAQL